MNMQKAQQGFTLIELMIVVAIIGILASIAIPAYQDYIAKSQFTAGLAEINPGKVMTETFLNEGTAVTDPDEIGLLGSTDNCSAITAAGAVATGVATLTCVLKGSAAILGKTITLSRTGAGVWSCKTDADSKHRGKCAAAA